MHHPRIADAEFIGAIRAARSRTWAFAVFASRVASIEEFWARVYDVLHGASPSYLSIVRAMERVTVWCSPMWRIALTSDRADARYHALKIGAERQWTLVASMDPHFVVPRAITVLPTADLEDRDRFDAAIAAAEEQWHQYYIDLRETCAPPPRGWLMPFHVDLAAKANEYLHLYRTKYGKNDAQCWLVAFDGEVALVVSMDRELHVAWRDVCSVRSGVARLDLSALQAVTHGPIAIGINDVTIGETTINAEVYP